MLQTILFLLLAYVLYRFVFNFVIPVFLATRQFKRQVREFHSRMHTGEESSGYQSHTNHQQPNNRTSPIDRGDYIEFEEVK